MHSKILILLVLFAVLLGVVACGGGATPTPAPTPAEAVPEPAAWAQPVPPGNPAQAQRPSASGKHPESAWEEAPCPMDLPPGAIEGQHITCGHVTVPEVRDPSRGGGAEGRAIRLAVAVIHSASDDPAPDPLVMLAGGPGDSALTSFVQLLATPRTEGFWAERDIVLVEQRGTRYSTPFLRCDEMSALKLDLLNKNLGDEEEEARKLAAWAACRERFVESGVYLAAYNSVENAADIVAVVDALGYDQVNLYGGSYGSLLAQHIMRDYPERVRSAILDAVSPLRHEPNMLYKAHATDHALRLLFTRCRDDAACNETYPDLEHVYFDLVHELNVEPATVQLQDPDTAEVYDLLLTGERLIAQTRDLLYVSAILPLLPGAIYDMVEGDFSLLALIQSQFMFKFNLADGMYNSVICTELADFTAADMADTEGLYPEVALVVEDLIDEVMLQPCQLWGVEHLGDWVTEPVTGDIPTLLLSGEFDPTVPPRVADVAAEQLTHAYLYTFPGVGHSLLGSSDCAAAMMLAFLDNPGQAPDATCLDEMPGLVFRLPVAEIALDPFVDEARGFRGLVPAGWQELAPANLARANSATDPAYFVLEAQPVTAAELFGGLAGQLGLAPELQPTIRADIGSLTWDLYALEIQGHPADLALAEDGEKACFVLLISPADEHEALYEQLFLPALTAMVIR
ncbi:MAG: alpha/beta fold hydrolase [Anaerolineae bacterium]|nr:alpha/beta fold hydrolase [Anaerolineae bacterium]